MPTGSPPRRAAKVEVPAMAVDASDWPVQAADTIERVVGSVRDKTTGPAITAARWLVYGTFALLVAAVVGVLLAIAAVRALNVYLPSEVFGHEHTWLAHTIVGGVFAIAGMLLWSRRAAPADDVD